jgi:acetaldehyde dehydrogenase/alcohol dehydrogenase
MSSHQFTTGLDLEAILDRAEEASWRFRQFDQEEVDRIVYSVYAAAFRARVYLAKLAWEETGLGRWEDKVIKNTLATKITYEEIKNIRTAGPVAVNQEEGIIEIAEPVGPIVALTPITNPTSTVLFKILIALKTRNPIIIRPHGGARRCSIEAARLCYEAALKAGAPENCIQWIKMSTREETASLMAHPKTALVMATGSVDVVRAALNSGKPSIGIGPGNVPVFIDPGFELATACEAIVSSKTFDYGSVCASEQALVVLKEQADHVRLELEKRGAHFLTHQEIKKLEPVAYNSQEGSMRVEVIGQPAAKIASLAGFEVPETTTILVAPLEEIGPQAPLSLEILAPILAFYVAEDEEEAFKLCREILNHGGLGHTASIFSNRASQIARFAREMPAGRILINTPASLGALGGLYNRLKPSLVLACGPAAGNIFMDNISVQHLFYRKKIVEPRLSPWYRKEIRALYLDETISPERLDDLVKS